MSVLTRDYTLSSRDADLYRRWRLSDMFARLQEIAIAHSDAMGLGKETTLDRGLLWVVTQQYAQITRLPRYGESIRMSTWAGRTRHMLFPRYFRVETDGGEPLADLSSLWVLVDGESRKMVSPTALGLAVEGDRLGTEAPLPRLPRSMPTRPAGRFTVPYSFLDMNGHMNNTRYFDLAEDHLPPELRALPLRELTVEYLGEAVLGDEITLGVGREEDRVFVTGETDKPAFRLCLRYAEE